MSAIPINILSAKVNRMTIPTSTVLMTAEGEIMNPY